MKHLISKIILERYDILYLQRVMEMMFILSYTPYSNKEVVNLIYNFLDSNL